jgi:hypothetical protein
MSLRLKLSPFKKSPLQIQKPPMGYKNHPEALFVALSGNAFSQLTPEGRRSVSQ